MFSNIIEFSAHQDIVSITQARPHPIKLNIPEWYKKLKNPAYARTIKGCMPFLDTLTTGYVLKIPQQMYLKHNFEEDGIKKTILKSASDEYQILPNMEFIYNVNLGEQTHSTDQLKDSPHVDHNRNLPVHKILNPWYIKTPPGYSCLFLPPMNNGHKYISIIPGIVATDEFPYRVNFPFLVNGDKYPIVETMLEIGTPYVQVIPFKRKSWKMKIKGLTTNEISKVENSTGVKFSILHTYKEKFWSKPTWK